MLQRVVHLTAVIPARFAAVRLPGKPLADILGKPMVVRVAEACARAPGLNTVAVATDDERIAKAVRDAGYLAVMTDPACKNGTERVAQAARELPGDAFLNVQGDEPLVEPEAIATLAALMRTGVDYGTLARPLAAGEEHKDSVVKVVLDAQGRALYFSRSLLPFPRTPGLVQPLAHLGLYGFSKPFLQAFARLPETALEQAEGLEQLRALFHGHALHVRVGDFHSVAVDTPADLDHVRELFAAFHKSATPASPERRTA
ncbi:MAG: 3-deoxy-manno-octulosonate cytidylyltransferase [Deltaproteobacteria bacterium]|nr:3-deoxy-manno-octulosonate cytidylyltransferase [Deltaproteobacteria bacterium]